MGSVQEKIEYDNPENYKNGDFAYSSLGFIEESPSEDVGEAIITNIPTFVEKQINTGDNTDFNLRQLLFMLNNISYVNKPLLSEILGAMPRNTNIPAILPTKTDDSFTQEITTEENRLELIDSIDDITDLPNFAEIAEKRGLSYPTIKLLGAPPVPPAPSGSSGGSFLTYQTR